MEEVLISLIKQQAEVFLLDAGEFFPFGVAISNAGEAIPLAAYIEDENDIPNSTALIALLKDTIEQNIASNKYQAAAIGVDVILRENGEEFDAIQIQIFEKTASYYQNLKYTLNENNVYFGD